MSQRAFEISPRWAFDDGTAPRAREVAGVHAAWARGLGLSPDARGQRFRGRVGALRVVFSTAVAGGRVPVAAELVVLARMSVEGGALLTRSSGVDPLGGRLAALLAEPRLRALVSIGVTEHFVRLRFEPWAAADALDHALEAIAEIVARR